MWSSEISATFYVREIKKQNQTQKQKLAVYSRVLGTNFQTKKSEWLVNGVDWGLERMVSFSTPD